MISSIYFLTFPSFSLAAVFIPLLIFLPFPIQSSLFLFFSFILRLFSSHSSSFLLFQFELSFPHSFARYKFIITMLFLFLCKFFNLYLFFFYSLLLLFSSSPLLVLLLPLLFVSMSQCDDFLNFPCYFLGAVLPALALYPSLGHHSLITILEDLFLKFCMR